MNTIFYVLVQCSRGNRKYESGAVGSFLHTTTLQGHNYSCELEVHADGYALKYVP